MSTEADIHKLQSRIEYLEDNRRYIQNALESVLSLGEFQATIENKPKDVNFLLERAAKKICSIIPFGACAFYLVDEESYLFDLAFCDTPAALSQIEKEVEYMIDEGMFAWAVREKRGVFIPAQEGSGQFLLHVITADGRIDGMFIGALPERKHSIADTSLTLLSIVLLRVANALEDLKFCRFLENQKEILEKQVNERTKALTRSEAELKHSMEKATQLAREAKKASEAKSDFLAKMSHELRTPLNGIIGMVEVALSTGLDENQQQLLEIVDRESCNLLEIINDILDFSKVEAGKLEIEQAPFDLHEIVGQVAETMSLGAIKKGLRLNTFVDPAISSHLIGDALRLKQVLVNLAGNAMKFTDQGEINILATQISNSPEAATIKLLVQDTGIGIAQDKQATIFEGFSQADESTTRKYGGTGLGITISKQLVELMGGDLSLQSKEQEGSTFWFTLPYQKQPHTGNKEQITATASPNHVLIIDDSATGRRIMADYLQAMDCHVVTAASEQEAMASLNLQTNENPPMDYIFIDTQMDGLDETALVGRLKRLAVCQHTRLIAVCQTDMQFECGHNETGFDRSLPRPLNYKAIETLLNALRGHEPASTVGETSEGMRKAIQVDEAGAGKADFKILLVDDYPTNQKVAGMHLSGAGYTVTIAEDGRKAVAAFEDNAFDLILMDIQMPVMDGFTATRRIRAIEQGAAGNGQTGKPANAVPIIAMTAHAYKEDKQKCQAAGMDDFIAKPIRKKELLSTVERWRAGNHNATPAAPPQSTLNAPSEPMDFATAVSEFGSRELVMEVAEEMVQYLAKQIKVMSGALADKAFDKLRWEAHSIKGGAGTIEAHTLAMLAKKIEDASRDDDPVAVEQSLTKLRAEYDRFSGYVAELKKEF